MVNALGFSERLKELISHLGLSSAAFAQSIDVNRSSISHLLSGRNKPSLDVIVKILETYPEVDLYWLLNGKGNFKPKVAAESPKPKQQKIIYKEPDPEPLVQKTPEKPALTSLRNSEEIDRIVVFYKDGRFKSYKN